MYTCGMRRVGAIVLCLGALSGCVYDAPEVFARADIQQTVDNWVNCDECWNRQLEHVVMLGDQALPTLLDYLDNSSSSILAVPDLRYRYGAAYDDLEAHVLLRGLGPLAEDKDDYVARHIRQYRNNYKTRAAIAVVEIDEASLPADWDSPGVRRLADP